MGRKWYCISVIAFLYFNSKICKRLPNKLPLRKKNHINAKQSCQIALFNSKTATESLKPCTVCCFDLQSSVKIILYKLGSKCLLAQYSYKTRLKDPGVGKTKRVIELQKTTPISGCFCQSLWRRFWWQWSNHLSNQKWRSKGPIPDWRTKRNCQRGSSCQSWGQAEHPFGSGNDFFLRFGNWSIRSWCACQIVHCAGQCWHYR